MLKQLADVAPHFDGFDRAFELVDDVSPTPRNGNEVPDEIGVDSLANFLDLSTPDEDPGKLPYYWHRNLLSYCS